MNLNCHSFPHPQHLQNLAKGSLEQVQNLTRALRLWVLLRWLYSDKGNTIGDSFTYNEWRQTFFSKTHKDEKQEDIQNHKDPNCVCNKTTKQWLIDFEVNLDEWRSVLQQKISIADSDIDRILEERLFAQVRKSLQSDFDLLVNRKCLHQLENVTGRSKHFCRVEELKIFTTSENITSDLTQKKQKCIAGALGIFSFLDPRYPLLAEEFSEDIDEDNHRVFLYVDYVVPESSHIQDVVDEIQSELQQIWDSGKIQPLLLSYHSAHQNQIKECAVYPVCIYFMEYAKYLCAYGRTPKDEINWYKYRLDRIISQGLELLEWQDPRVPQLLREQHQMNKLYTPKTVNDKLKEAWGCDFYKTKSLMILRFDQDFDKNYVKGINVHDTFKPIEYKTAFELIQQHTLDPGQQKNILKAFKSRPNTDAYYQVYYRVTDYYVLRWLRALGSKVEVLLPWDLRQQMVDEIQKTWNLYANL
ncbi:MAG: TIGR03985 family CRISPR-associated protein [Calothrix sp. C42_A2020_038]|nr:TIGR03985 family CRISPR-associated protein [Calothrix sp. C42_A2020_038]